MTEDEKLMQKALGTMPRWKVYLDVPMTTYLHGTIIIEAESPEDAKQTAINKVTNDDAIVWDIEDGGEPDWDDVRAFQVEQITD